MATATYKSTNAIDPDNTMQMLATVCCACNDTYPYEHQILKEGNMNHKGSQAVVTVSERSG